jgi:hypothetical protein
MLKAIEVAFYQFGLRLSRCHELHDRCTEKEASEPTGTFAGADCVVMLKHTLRSLDSAYAQLAQIAGCGSADTESGKALIQDIIKTWKKWSRLSTVELHDEYFDDSPVLDGFERIEVFIQGLLEKPACVGTKCEQWYELGKEICCGYWRGLCERPRPAGAHTTGDDEQSAQVKQNPQLRWSCEATVRELMKEVGVTEKDLVPELENKGASRGLLPGDIDRDEIWYRAESALSGLIQSTSDRSAFSVPELSVEQASEQIRLQVSPDQELAILDGQPYKLQNQDAAYYLQALLDAQGDWLGPSDLVEKCPIPGGIRPDRIKKNLPSAIRDLVETKPAKGSRIALAKLRA